MIITRIFLLSFFTLFFSFDGFAQKNVARKSKKTIEDFKNTDASINKLFDTAYGYAVFPSVGKGGIGIGGAFGNGTVYQSGKAVGDCKLTQVSIGFQFGGQKYAEVIFFETEEVYDRFISSKYEFAAQVSAVALASGASADAKYRDGIVVFTNSIGGLMYEASIGGQKFKTRVY